MQKKQQQDQSQIKWISDFIWNIADNRLRDVYVPASVNVVGT
jgi:type I restriction enzyme M protein